MDELDEVVAALERGRAVVLPTDTVYGLAALPAMDRAVRNLFELKGRGAEAPIAVLCASSEQAFALARDVSSVHRSIARACWPGPLTLVLRRRAALSWDLGEPADTIGVRVPDDPLIRALTEQVGPIAATSANRHGSDPATTAEEARMQLGGDVVLVDGGRLGTVASTVVDATGKPWKVLRIGAVSVADLEAAGAPL